MIERITAAVGGLAVGAILVILLASIAWGTGETFPPPLRWLVAAIGFGIGFMTVRAALSGSDPRG